MTKTILMTLALGLLVAGGCANDHTVTFVNSTDRDVTATLSGPGDIEPSPATLPVSANGGRAQFKVTVDEDDLPASYTWTANGRRGSLVVDEDSRKDQVITITEKERDVEHERLNRTTQ